MKQIKFMIVGVIGAIGSFALLPIVTNQVAKVFPQILPTETDTLGGMWKLLAVVGALIGLLFSLFSRQVGAFVNRRGFVIIGMLAAVASLIYGVDSEVIGAALLFTVPANVTQTNTVQYCPANLVFTTPTPPTLLQVNIAGRGTAVNLDQAGIQAINQNYRFGLPANTYVIPLGDGSLVERNTLITLGNADAAPVAVFGNGMARMSVLQVHSTEVVLANSGATFRDFFALNIPGAQAGDIIQVSYSNGFTQQYEFNEFVALAGAFQANGQVLINNNPASIREVYYAPIANRNVYVSSFSIVA